MKTVVLPNSTIALLNDFVTGQRDRTISWLRSKLGLSRSDAEDIFQDAFLVLYNNLTNGTLTEWPHSLGTYINEVCRRKALEVIRTKEQHQGKGTVEADDDQLDVESEGAEPTEWDDDLLEEVIIMNGPQEEAERIDRQEAAVREVVRDLPDPCNKLLWGFYFDGYSMKEMA